MSIENTSWCDLCYSAACLGDADDTSVRAITDITGAEGILEFGSAVQFEDICSYLQNLALKALVPQQLNLVRDWFVNCHLNTMRCSHNSEIVGVWTSPG